MNTQPENTRKTLAEFITEHGITSEAVSVPENPYTAGDKWAETARHYRVTLKNPSGQVFHVPFSMGAGHVEKVPYESIPGSKRMGLTRRDWENMPQPGMKATTMHQAAYMGVVWRPTKPDTADVLNCLMLDSMGYDNARDFEDWAAEYGYDPDSRKAEASWRVVGEQARKLRRFLGSAAYADLMECESL